MTKREREGREVAKDTRATSRGGVRAHKKSGGKWDYDIDDDTFDQWKDVNNFIVNSDEEEPQESQSKARKRDSRAKRLTNKSKTGDSTKGVTGSPKSGVKVKRAESNIGKSSLASKTTAGVSSASRRSTDDKSMQQSTPTTGTARSPSDAAKRPRETSVGRSRLNKAPRGSVGTASSAQSLLAVSDSGTNDDAQYRAKRHEELKAELFPEDVLT